MQNNYYQGQFIEDFTINVQILSKPTNNNKMQAKFSSPHEDTLPVLKLEEIDDFNVSSSIPSPNIMSLNLKQNLDSSEDSCEGKKNVATRLELKGQTDQQIQHFIKAEIYKKLIDINNKHLYPDLMGPHQLYTFQSKLNNYQAPKEVCVDLKEHLRSWFQNLIAKQDSSEQILLQQSQYCEQNNGISANLKKERRGQKYKKYSLDLKINIVNRIKDQMQAEGTRAKSMRYYIVREASKLKIHPKNIARWLQIENLDKKQGGRKAKFPRLEQKLAYFIQKNPNCKRKIILKEARRILQEIGGNDNFNLSKGWYQRFKARLKQHKIMKSDQSNQIGEN